MNVSKLPNWLINYVLKQMGVIPMLDKLRDAVSGKKTYLVAVSAIIGVLVAWSTGSIDAATAIKSIVEAILACTVRAGVSKVG